MLAVQSAQEAQGCMLAAKDLDRALSIGSGVLSHQAKADLLARRDAHLADVAAWVSAQPDPVAAGHYARRDFASLINAQDIAS